jgi:hypothetical protein
MELKHLLPFLLLVLPACDKEQWDDCITSTGPERIEQRTVGPFTRLELNDRIDLVLEDRPTGTLEVEGGRNLLGQVGTEVHGGTLVIVNDNRCNWVRSFKPRITVRVAASDVAELELRGTGNVTATTTIVRNVFKLDQQGGQGSTHLQLDVDSCRIGSHAGAGGLTCTGTARVVFLYVGSMGPVDAGGLEAEQVDAHNNGMGDLRCRATERAHVIIRHVGDVYCGGTAPAITTDITGSGQLVRTP